MKNNIFKTSLRPKIVKIILGSVIAAIALFAYVGIAAMDGESRKLHLIHAKLGNVDLHIPLDYLRFTHTSAGNESALIQAWYPGSAITPGQGNNMSELWEDGLAVNKIRILINSRPHTIPWSNEQAKKLINIFSATEDVGVEYGLLHKTQPTHKVQDNRDVWVEMNGEEIVSLISCDDPMELEHHVPQCKHLLNIHPQEHGRIINIRISYDRRFLPEWKTIKDNVLDLVNSFKTPQTATAYYTIQKEKTPQFPIKAKHYRNKIKEEK